MTTDWMSPAGPDDAWHGDDRADDGGRLDPDTGWEVPAARLDPPETRPDGRSLDELVDAVIFADDRLSQWNNQSYFEFQQRHRALRRAVAALRAARKATQS